MFQFVARILSVGREGVGSSPDSCGVQHCVEAKPKRGKAGKRKTPCEEEKAKAGRLLVFIWGPLLVLVSRCLGRHNFPPLLRGWPREEGLD